MTSFLNFNAFAFKMTLRFLIVAGSLMYRLRDKKLWLLKQTTDLILEGIDDVFRLINTTVIN